DSVFTSPLSQATLSARKRPPRLADRMSQPQMRGISVDARMPSHQIIEPSQHGRRLQNSQGQIVCFELRDPCWNGREQIGARYAAARGGERRDPDGASPLLANARQSLIGESLQLVPDADADMFRRKILLQGEDLRILRVLVRDA